MESPKEGPFPIIVEDSSAPLLEPSFCSPRFSLPCFRHRRALVSSTSSSFWERIGSSRYNGRWWAPGLRVIKKIREWSELIAGPKWKTFIRRIRRKGARNSGGGVVGSAGGGGGKLNYDLVNYSLNFDECHGNFDDEDEFRRLRSFSVGYGGKEAAGLVAA